MPTDYTDKIRGLVHALMNQCFQLNAQPGPVPEVAKASLEDEFTRVLTEMVPSRWLDHHFVAYVDRTIATVKISVDIGVDAGSPEEELFAGHLVGLLRNEVEGTINHVATMRAIDEIFHKPKS